MPSANYDLFSQAMTERKPIVCMYQGHPRAICPIILGHSGGADEMALTYQFGGNGSKGPVHGAMALPGTRRWLTAPSLSTAPGGQVTGHSQSQGCVKDVDLDVNPDSPYDPKRRLKSRTG